MTRYFHLVLTCLLLTATLPAAATENPDSTRLKGRIWTLVARRVWQARVLGPPAPPEWPSPTAAEQWLRQHDAADQSGMRELLGQTRSTLQQKGVSAATPTQLVDVMVDLIRHNKQKLAKVKSAAVEAELRMLLTSQRPDAPAGTQTVATPSTPLGLDSVAGPAASVGGAVASSDTASALRNRQPKNWENNQNPAGRNWPLTLLIALASAVGGGVFGWWLRARWGRPDTELLEEKIESLKRKLQQEKNKSFQVKPATAVKAEPSTAFDTQNVPESASWPTGEMLPVETASVQLPIVEKKPAAVVPRVFFAALREGGFLEDSQLRTEASPHHALKIVVDGRDQKKARFELNAAADQQSLIEYRLDLLREYFVFNLPAGRPSVLATREQGRLVREASGWRVASNHKGQLDVR